MKVIHREEFLNSKHLKITLFDLQKKLMHHNRFVLEVVVDTASVQVHKKYSQLRLFTQEIQKRLGLTDFAMYKHLRSADQYRSVETFISKLNNGLLMPPHDSVKYTELRGILHKLLFDSLELDSEEQTLPKSEVELKPERAPIRDSFRQTLKTICKSKKDEQDISPLREIIKTIKCIWVQEGQTWQQKQFSLHDNLLTLYAKDRPTRLVVLTAMQVTLLSDSPTCITLAHDISISPISLRLSAADSSDELYYQQYLAFYTRLKEASVSPRTVKVRNLLEVQLTVRHDLQKKWHAKELAVKLVHQTINLHFTATVGSCVHVVLPILHNYSSIEFELTQCRDLILLPTFREHTHSISLPLQSIYDLVYNDRPKRKSPEVRMHQFETKDSAYLLQFEYKQTAKPQAYLIAGEQEQWQGEDRPDEFTRDQLRVQKNRLRRAVWSIQSHLAVVAGLKNFEVPLYSYFFYLFLLLVVLLFDAQYILQYVLVLLLGLLAYCHPHSHSYLREAVTLIKQSRVLHDLKSRQSYSEFKIRLKSELEKQEFLRTFTMASKNKRNIYKKYKRLQEVLLKGQMYLTRMISLAEKVKNLFTWYHQKKTKLVFTLLLVALAGLLLLPLRLFFLLALLRIFRKGLSHIQRTKAVNKVIVTELIRVCIDENGLADLKQYEMQSTRLLDKRLPQYQLFEKKFKELCDNLLHIDYDAVLIFHSAKSLANLASLLSNCDTCYLLSAKACEKYGFNPDWSTHQNSLTNALVLLYGFLLNIPSDRNILAVVPDSDDHRQPDSNSDDEDEQVF